MIGEETIESTEPANTEQEQGGNEEQPQELFLGKFKSVGDLAKSYQELEKRFGAFKGAPKYGYKKPEDLKVEQLAIVEAVEAFGKEHQLTQEGFEKLFETLNESVSKSQEMRVEAAKAEIENFDQRAKDIVATARTVLSPDELKALDGALTSRESFEAFEKLTEALRGTGLPATGEPAGRSADDIMRELMTVESADVETRNRLLRELQAVTGEEAGVLR